VWGALAGALLVAMLVATPATAKVVDHVEDDLEDVKECDSRTPAPDNTAADIDTVYVHKFKRKVIIEVELDERLEDIFDFEYSWAIRVTITFPDGRVRMFLIEVHEGFMFLGEIDPETGELLPEGPEIEPASKDSVDFTVDEPLPKGTKIEVETFNTPEEGDAKLCDRAQLTLDKKVDPRDIDLDPPEPKPPITGPVDEVTEVIL